MALASLFLEAIFRASCVSGYSFALLVANSNPPLAGNLNFVFVVSEDMAFITSGDIDPATANLTDSGEPSRCEWTELRAVVFRSEPYHAAVERFRGGPAHRAECSNERLLYLGIA